MTDEQFETLLGKIAEVKEAVEDIGLDVRQIERDMGLTPASEQKTYFGDASFQSRTEGDMI